MPYSQYSVADWLDAFFGDVLAQLGMYATSWRLQFLETWSHFETAGGQTGTGPYYNPLGTTYRTQNAAPNYGGQENVWHYPTPSEGVYATAQTLKNYPSVIATLSNEKVNPGTVNEIGASWGTGGFATQLTQGWTPSGPSESIPTLGLAAKPSPTPPQIPPSISPPPVAPPIVPTYSLPANAPTPTPVTPIAPPNVFYNPAPQPAPVSQGLINIPQASLQPGQFNVITTGGGTVGGLEGWSLWQQQPNGNWQQWNQGEYISPGQKLGVLPNGLSLPGGLTAR